MSFIKKGTFGKNYADNLDKNICPECGKLVHQSNDEKELKSTQICQCKVSNKEETDCEGSNEEHKN